MIRRAFEKWISRLPFEREIDRWPDDPDKYGWPGCYKDMEVALVWVAYQEGNRMTDQLKRILVCGGREFNDWRFLQEKLKALVDFHWMFILVHGDCRGADRLAGSWAESIELIVEKYPADWKQYGTAAGNIRNQQMIDTGIDYAVAFPGGSGTADMVSRLLKANVQVWDLRGGR